MGGRGNIDTSLEEFSYDRKQKWNGDQRGCESKKGLMVASVMSGRTPVDKNWCSRREKG